MPRENYLASPHWPWPDPLQRDGWDLAMQTHRSASESIRAAMEPHGCAYAVRLLSLPPQDQAR
jgi:hypothetical protein